VWDTRRMNAHAAAPSDKRQRFPPAIIGHAVWRSFRFALSYRDVEELLAARGVIVTDETIRQWCRKLGQRYANELRRRRPRPGDKGHRDEVFISINGVFSRKYPCCNLRSRRCCWRTPAERPRVRGGGRMVARREQWAESAGR